MYEKRAKELRNRVSYQRYKTLNNLLTTKRPTVAEILRATHKLIDDYYGYKSWTNSNCARESIDLIIEENREVFDNLYFSIPIDELDKQEMVMFEDKVYEILELAKHDERKLATLLIALVEHDKVCEGLQDHFYDYFGSQGKIKC